MDFLMSGVAACGACVFTNPLEVVKTRMQLQGELQAPGTYQRHYRNVFHAFFTIGKVDGLAALQKGLGPALLYQFLMNGIRLGTYGRDWPETWSSGVVAWGRRRPAQSCHRLLHPAVHLLIHQGPLEPVGDLSSPELEGGSGSCHGEWSGSSPGHDTL